MDPATMSGTWNVDSAQRRSLQTDEVFYNSGPVNSTQYIFEADSLTIADILYITKGAWNFDENCNIEFHYAMYTERFEVNKMTGQNLVLRTQSPNYYEYVFLSKN